MAAQGPGSEPLRGSGPAESGSPPEGQRNGQRRPLNREEAAKLAEQMAAMLALINSGELETSTATKYRLEGALTTLEAVLGRPQSLLDDLPDQPT